jgi:tRNA A-37 threonylcarbamoyl transferase component Bud32
LNGAKADVHLIEDGSGSRSVRKCYRRGFVLPMLREYLALSYLSRSGVGILPRVLDFHPLRREIVLSYLPGERVLEWVLKRYGRPDLELEAYKSFHGLDTNPDVAQAFQRFRDSKDRESLSLKAALITSYRVLHARRFVHGDPSPRNLIFDGTVVYLIDFDHSRPSLDPAGVDFVSIRRWYGLSRMD